MAKLRNSNFPSPLLRFGNRSFLRMEPNEFLEIWECSDGEFDSISEGWSLEELKDFSSVPAGVAYRLGLFHQLWSRQIDQAIEQGEQQREEFSVPEPVTPPHCLWSELDELYAFDMTPREFQVFWDVKEWELARILRVDIQQVRRYLRTPPNSSPPALVCFFLGSLHYRWLQRLANGESPSQPLSAALKVARMPQIVPLLVDS